MCDCLSILLACKILSIGDDVFQQYWGKAVHVFHATFDSETSATASHGLHLLEAIRHQLEQAQISSFEFSSDLANLLSSSNVFLASQVSRMRLRQGYSRLTEGCRNLIGLISTLITMQALFLNGIIRFTNLLRRVISPRPTCLQVPVLRVLI